MLIYNYGWLYIFLIIFWLFIKNFMSYWLRLLKADIEIDYKRLNIC